MKYSKGLRRLSVGLVSALLATMCFADDDDHDLAVNKVKGSLSVMVLGSGGPVATAEGRASAGYLIFLDGKPRILMDVGGGTYQRIAESGVNIRDLDTVLLTHLHIDHTGDLSAAIKTIYFHNNLARGVNPALPGRTAAINIYGPSSTSFPNGPGGKFPGTNVLQYPSTEDYVHQHYSVQQGGVERYLNGFAPAISQGASAFAYTANDLSSNWMMAGNIETVLDENEIGGTGKLKITAIAINHGPVPAVGFRVDYKGHSVVYSGDTSTKTNNMTVLSEGADLLIYDTAITETLPANPVFHLLHTKPRRIGEVAAAANVKKLVLSHLTPVTATRIKEVKADIRENYLGRIKVAKDLKVYNLGHDD